MPRSLRVILWPVANIPDSWEGSNPFSYNPGGVEDGWCGRRLALRGGCGALAPEPGLGGGEEKAGLRETEVVTSLLADLADGRVGSARVSLCLSLF